MENILCDLSLKFQNNGFIPVEIQYLIKDVFDVLDEGRYCTLAEVNQNLEDLGWGIEIMDTLTYALLVNKSLTQ